MLGRVELPMSHFCRQGVFETTDELWNFGFPAGNIRFKPIYEVQAVAAAAGTTTTTVTII